MESHKIMCHFLYYCIYWLVFGLADRIYDISSASGNNNFQVGVWMLLWLSAGLQVKTCHFLDSPPIKKLKILTYLAGFWIPPMQKDWRQRMFVLNQWSVWKSMLLKKDHEKRGNAQNTAEWQSDNRENVKHIKRNQSFFSELIRVQIVLQMQPDGGKKVDSDKRFSAFCPDAEWCTAFCLSCCQRET